MDIQNNIELEKTYTQKQELHQEMQNIQKNFKILEQQINQIAPKYQNTDMIIELKSISQQRKSYVYTRQTKFIINGQFQPSGQKSYQTFILQFIQSIPRPKNPYGLIYINTLAESNAFSDFKKVLNELPIDYLLNLTKIHVLEPSFFDKTVSWFQFGTVACYINKKIVNVYSLRQLSKSTFLQLQFLCKMVPKNVSNYYVKTQNYLQKDQKIQQIASMFPSAKQTNKTTKSLGFSSSQDNYFKSQKLTKINEEYSKNNRVQLSQQHIKRQISDYELGQNGAPLILQILIDCFYKNEQLLKQQGLFRKSVSIDDQKEISSELNKSNYKILSEITNPHLIASAIKKFIYNLKSPLIPYRLFEEIMSQDKQPKLSKVIIEGIRQLPNVNQMAILVLFDFLKNKVAPLDQYNKMGENNLCIVFGPCIMKSLEPGSLKELIYAKKIIVATSIIMKQLNKIFGQRVVLHQYNILNRQSNSLSNQQKLYQPKDNGRIKMQNKRLRQQSIRQSSEKRFY